MEKYEATLFKAVSAWKRPIICKGATSLATHGKHGKSSKNQSHCETWAGYWAQGLTGELDNRATPGII